MQLEIRPFGVADAAAHSAGEDELTVRWLTGGYSDAARTAAHVRGLQAEIDAGRRKRAFGVWLDGRLCGYVDYDPDLDDGIGAEDVNLSYSVHPWARGRGVAVQAVHLVCQLLREQGIGLRSAIRVDPANHRSVRVAEKAGFTHLRDVVSATDTDPDGSPTTLGVYVRDL